jgi:hypothetical protein
MVLCQPQPLTTVRSGMLQFENISHLSSTCTDKKGTAVSSLRGVLAPHQDRHTECRVCMSLLAAQHIRGARQLFANVWCFLRASIGEPCHTDRCLAPCCNQWSRCPRKTDNAVKLTRLCVKGSAGTLDSPRLFCVVCVPRTQTHSAKSSVEKHSARIRLPLAVLTPYRDRWDPNPKVGRAHSSQPPDKVPRI